MAKIPSAQAGYMDLAGAMKDADCRKVEVAGGVSKSFAAMNSSQRTKPLTPSDAATVSISNPEVSGAGSEHNMPKPHPKNDNVKNLHPLSAAAGLEYVSAGPVADHPGFDSEQVKVLLGTTRYNALLGKLTRMFVCGHSTYPLEHPLEGAEVPCVYAVDLEAFIKAGG